MRFICGLCNDLRLGKFPPDTFALALRTHLALHRRAGDDVVCRMFG